MKYFSTLISASLFLVSACKQASESGTSTASKYSEISAQVCQLSDVQVRLIASSKEFKGLEKVDSNALPTNEKQALEGARANSDGCPRCDTDGIYFYSHRFALSRRI